MDTENKKLRVKKEPPTGEDLQEIYSFAVGVANEALELINTKVIEGRPPEERWLISQRVVAMLFQLHHKMTINNAAEGCRRELTVVVHEK